MVIIVVIVPLKMSFHRKTGSGCRAVSGIPIVVFIDNEFCIPLGCLEILGAEKKPIRLY